MAEDNMRKKEHELKDKYMKFGDDNRDRDSDDEEEEQIVQTMKAGPQEIGNSGGFKTDFQRKGAANASLEDFTMLKIVGKGTFGKVFKV